MRKRIFCLLALIACIPCFKSHAQLVYTDATTLPVYGKICENTSGPFTRLPESIHASLNERERGAVWSLGLDSSGEYIRFRSDAGKFEFVWKSLKKASLDNMAACGVRGLALYVYDKGEWIYAGTARPTQGDFNCKHTVSCDKLKGEMREYMLYLSLYDGVESLQIGVEEGMKIEQPILDSPRAAKPFIIYGTSIMQGASASHPGMCSSNVLTRLLNRQVINLGFSGNGQLDPEVAQIMADYPDPGCYVMDEVPNCGAERIHKYLAPFVEILRKDHPDTPIVFVENPIYPGTRFDNARDKDVSSRNQALREEYAKFKKAGMKHIYYVKGDKLLPADNVGTMEGTHFTDLGFQQYCKVLYPVLKRF